MITQLMLLADRIIAPVADPLWDWAMARLLPFAGAQETSPSPEYGLARGALTPGVRGK